MKLKRMLALTCAMVMVTAQFPMQTHAAKEEQINAEQEEVEDVYEIVEVSTREDLAELSGKCRLGSYSENLRVELKADINLAEANEKIGFSTFSGIFSGNNHVIKGLKIDDGDETLGLFGFVEEGAVIENLVVEGEISSTDSKNYCGIIAGVNAGTIQNCTAAGIISGTGVTGGVVGLNGSNGVLSNCSNKAQVDSIMSVGGICGENRGTITNSTNFGQVNDDDAWLYYEDNSVQSMSLEGILGVLSTAVEVGSDIGGICGWNVGMVEKSKNVGTVGYPHAGKNVGGIVGRLEGQIYSCTNTGNVFGKQDVGGIVGQFNPEILEESGESLESAFQDLRELSDRLNDDMDAVSNAAKKRVNSAQDNMSDITDRLNEKANGKRELQHSGDTVLHMEAKQDIISGNIAQIKESVDNAKQEYDTAKKNVQDALAEGEQTYQDMMDEMNDLNDRLAAFGTGVEYHTNVIQNDVDEINDKLSDISVLTTQKVDNIKRIAQGESVVEDYSAVDPDNEQANRVENCTNEGYISGDRNVGGIAGALTVEKLEEAETSATSMAEKYVTIGVLRNCVDAGILEARKENVGGIIGKASLGFIQNCTAKGRVLGEEANFVGGVAGLAEGTISECNSLAVLNGAHYVGGIAGEGKQIRHCKSMAVVLQSDGWTGSVLGAIGNDNEGDITISHSRMMDNIYDNVFVSENLFGINGINYTGIAESVSYEELLAIENVSGEFTDLCITYVNPNCKILKSEKVSYGSTIENLKYPKLVTDDREYMMWEGLYSENVQGNIFLMAKEADEVAVLSSALEINQKPAVLVSDTFYENSVLNVTQEANLFDKIDENTKSVTTYHVQIENVEIGDQVSIPIRFYVGEEENVSVYWIHEGKQILLDSEKKGSYVESILTGNEGTFAIVVAEKQSLLIPIVFGVGAGVLVILLLVVGIKRRKKGKEKK